MSTGGSPATFPRRTGPHPEVIAHRGASADAPENTLAAFVAAWAAGARWVETDVQPTADGVPMLLHDDDLDRTTDGHGPIRSARAAELARLDAGSWFGDGDFSGQRIPALVDLLAMLTPERSLLLEIKGTHTPDELATTLAAIDLAGVGSRVTLQSFEIDVLRSVRALAPQCPFGLLVEQLHDDPVAVCAALGASAYNPDHTLLRERPTIVAALHEAGLTVCVWTADDPVDWQYLTDIGVDGIITNRPAQLLATQRRR